MRIAGILLLTSFVILSCGDHDSPSGPQAGAENEIENDLVFTRQDGNAVRMGSEYALCCGIWEEGYLDKNTVKMFLYDSRIVTDPENADSFWKLFIVLDEVEVAIPNTLPSDVGSPLRLYLVDLENSNELSSDTDDSDGTVTINSLECGPPLKVSLTIDATIGSEFFRGPTIRVSGTFVATVHSNPSPFGCDFSL